MNIFHEYELVKYYGIIRNNLFDTDYAIYNRSVCLGLIGKNNLKVDLLQKIASEYTTSSYYDKALYDLARFYKNTSQITDN